MNRASTSLSSALLASSLLMGCATTDTVPRDFLNVLADRKHVTVRMLNGTEISGDNIRLGPDTTTWEDPATVATRMARTDSVASVSWREHGEGATDGMIYGGGAGAIVGAGVAYGSNPTSPNFALLYGIAGGSILIGGAIGAIVGKQRTYILDHRDFKHGRNSETIYR